MTRMNAAVSVPTLHYVSGPTGSEDGAQIFDRKLLAALAEHGVAVSALHPRRQRALRFPLWQGRLAEPDAITAGLIKAREDGARIVLSHEGFFAIAHRMAVDLLIVHNYMPCFRFPGKRWLEAYYRTGSRAYFARAFANASAIVFVSYRDYRYAVSDFPQIAARSHVLPPPPHRVAIGSRRSDVIHMSGSEAWLPKRLSRLTADEQQQISAAGFVVEDFGTEPSSAFGLIGDRFSVGFKLKLMQMLYAGDAIASLSEIRDEIDALAPGYPYWKEVSSVSEALDWFRKISEEGAWLEESGTGVRDNLPDWTETARKLIGILG